MDNKQLVLDAANALINDPSASEMYHQLIEVLRLPSGLKVKLADEASVLNPLLKLGRDDIIKFNRVIDMVELRREARGLEPLKTPPDNKFDKNEYQRVLMAERRVRMVKAAEVENLQRPPSGQLVGNARMDFIKMQQSKWSKRLKERLEATFGLGPISKKDRAKVSEDFWAEIDQELEAAEEAVLRWIQNGRKGSPPQR